MDDESPSSQDRTLIRLRSISYTYPGAVGLNALTDIDLTLQSGEFVAMCGPSGSGKSTLLNVIGLLQRPTEGFYRFEGKDMAEISEARRAHLRASEIGFVFQSFHLVPGRTALQNIELAMLYTHSPDARRELAVAAAETVGISARLGHRPNELSGGERQRVAIARAIASSPELVLADEPTGNLDSRTADAVLRLFDEVNRLGITLLVVTHSEEVAGRCRRRIELRDGSIVSDRQVVS